MAAYMVQVSYTAEAMAALVANPQDRTKPVAAVIKTLGGKMNNFWFAFGDYDVVGIMEMPDNVSAAAFALAVSAGGSCRAVKTTPLLTISEAMAAMKKAGGSGYRPVRSK
jgi:uncharacterized protein with GYD domain